MSVEDTRKKIRKNDIEIIFRKCPEKCFGTALEVGGGDGFQSQLLSKYIGRLICTEKDDFRFTHNENSVGIEYKNLDAHEVSKAFDRQQFDLIFSSNVLEHVEGIGQVLAGFGEVLRNDGVMIHVMPNRLWVLLRILLVVPAHFFRIILQRPSLQNNCSGSLGQELKQRPDVPIKSSNTIAKVYRKLWPLPHGVSKSNLEEFSLFSRSSWQRCFDENGWQVYKIINLQLHSPHRFGFDRLRAILAPLRLCTTHAYIVIKKNSQSRYLNFF